MKVTLIAPPIMDYVDGRIKPIAMDAARECPPYGIYLLRGVLEKAGHEVTLIDLIAQGSSSLRPHRDQILASALVGIGATSLSWPTAKSVIEQIRSLHPTVCIVLGGIHPTMFDRYLLQHFPIEFVIRGEGELALASLCDVLERGGDISTVPNLTWYTKDREIVRNTIAPKIPKNRLADFPVPDYSLLPNNVYKGLAIESSRGCAFDCSFCSTSYRRSWRALDPNDFVYRIESIMPALERTKSKHVHIIDDEFCLNPKRALAITRKLHSRGLTPGLVYDARATDLIYPGLVLK